MGLSLWAVVPKEANYRIPNVHTADASSQDVSAAFKSAVAKYTNQVMEDLLSC